MKKIQIVEVQQGGSILEITFETPQYPGMLFSVSCKDGGIGAYGWEMLNDEKYPVMTERKKKYASKWIEKNLKDLYKYFSEECPDTKLGFLYVD